MITDQVYEYGGMVTHLRYGDAPLSICGKEPFLNFWYPVLEEKTKPLCKDCEKLNDGSNDS